MPLENLQSLIETLKERIAAHGTALKGSEALTRYVLIDPLLRELGWNTADPALVMPEYKSGKGRADYALLGSDGKPAMMIEAKSLGTSLGNDTGNDTRTQALLYCLQEGTKHFALTDGGHWEIYETLREGNIDEKRIVEFDVSAQPAAEVCLKALALWRPSMALGKITAGHAPLIQSEPAPSPAPSQPVPVVSDDTEWRSLSELKPPKRSRPPVEVMFPDNSLHPVKFWNSLVVEVVRWLVKNKHLHTGNCPIRQSSSSTWHLVSKEPVHATGKAFSRRVQVETVWVEKDYMIPGLVENTRTIIRHVGQNPSEFKVRFD